jgi:glucose-6-phosphate isomerase
MNILTHKPVAQSRQNHTHNSEAKNSIKNTLQALLNQSEFGFVKIPERLHLFEESAKLSAELKLKYNQFVIIGIGGSSMGARAIAELTHAQNIHFLDNVDQIEFSHIWTTVSKTSLKETAFIIVSKSGSTIEILWNYSALENLLKKQGLNIIDQSYFVTEKVKNPLADLAKKHGRPHLEVPVDVGGRFSVLTPVGLVISGLCGLDLEQMRLGAAQAIKDQNIVIQKCEMFLESFKNNEIITLFWFYHSNYRWFGGWLQQLWAESLGKKENKKGEKAPGFSTPMSAIGACDQHSILQQVAHGTKNKFVSFYTFTSAEKSDFNVKSEIFSDVSFMDNLGFGELIKNQSLATQEALIKNEVSTELFHVDDSNKAKTLGYLFMHFQLIVATLGLHEGINPFDQPGVTLGKDLTKKRLLGN